MEIALVKGARTIPSAGLKGTCPTCGTEMIAKCGEKVIHHWAHAGRRNCDPWWENETEWHREWKAHWPVECHEINHVAPDGEIHRADVKTPSGIYVEVQHSAMTDAERQSREDFYQNLVWIIDGRRFQKSFTVHHLLPDPSLPWAQDCRWFPIEHRTHQGATQGMYHKLSEIVEDRKRSPNSSMHRVYFFADERAKFEAADVGYRNFCWMRPHTTWLNATKPVYIDFGTDVLVRLDVYPVEMLRCVRLISKYKLIRDLGTLPHASEVCA